MPTLTGRLGNLLFQYSHARAWCQQNRYDLCLPPWVGEKVFDIPEAVRPKRFKPDMVWPENMRQNQESLIYTRRQVRDWFRFKPWVLDRLKSIKVPQILLNVRHNQDYRDAGLVTLSTECYVKACERFGFNVSLAEFETDSKPTRHPSFSGDPNGSGLGTSWVCIPSFYRLMSAPVLFRANSTFSWWAATLGNGRVFAPVIRGIRGGLPNAQCDTFVEGNWPAMTESPSNSDLYLKET